MFGDIRQSDADRHAVIEIRAANDHNHGEGPYLGLHLVHGNSSFLDLEAVYTMMRSTRWVMVSDLPCFGTCLA